MIGRGLLLSLFILPAAIAPAAACNCPKESMVERFGAIVPDSHKGPQKPPMVVSASELAASRLARRDLPLILPVHLVASDQIFSLVEGSLDGAAHE